MARDSFNADLQVREPYLSLVYVKTPGEASWTLIDQGKVVSPSRAAEQKEYKRIGDQNVTKRSGAITTDVTVQIYLENNVEELGRFLGFTRPPGGWLGTEEITLDPTRVVDIKVENFDGVTATSNLVFTEYANAFNPANMAVGLDADSDARVGDVSGSAATYYIIPVAG